jgi:hypothetical protein
MMLSRRRSIVLALVCSWLVASGEASNSTFTCSLNCLNSGYCEYVTGSDAELQAMLQSGIMIMQCICPEQYTGMGCELERPVCNLSTLKCPNGAACEQDPHDPTQYNCDCSIADTVSYRASQFCRRTYTEYCYSGSSSQLKRDTEMGIAFCTNGGKCKGDILAAKEAPWNTTANALYEQAGCNCPAEYYGPHCEFLRHKSSVPEQVFPNVTVNNNATASPTETMAPSMMNTQSLQDLIGGFDNQSSTESTNKSSGDDKSNGLRITLICVLLSVGVVCTTLALLTYRHRRTRQRRSLLLRLKAPSSLNSPCSMTSSSNTTHDHIQQQSLINGEIAPPTAKKSFKKKKKKRRHSTVKVIQLKPALSADDQDIVSLPNDSYHPQHSLVPFVVNEEQEEFPDDEPTDSLWNDESQNVDDPLSPVASSALVATDASVVQATPWSARVTHLAAAMVRKGSTATAVPSNRCKNDVYVVEEDEPFKIDDDEDVHLNRYCHPPV